MYFGDDVRGHVMSTTFLLQDTQARGFHRWFSVVVWMADKYSLLNSWPFFEKHIKQLVTQLQHKSSMVFENEENACPQRALRLSAGEHAAVNKASRSLVDLTATPAIFIQVHLWFTWLLSAWSKRLEEKQVHLTSRNLDCAFHEEAEDAKKLRMVTELSFGGESCANALRSLRRQLGPTRFQQVFFSVVTGCQVVIRGPKHIVLQLVASLKYLVPERKARCLEFSETYEPPSVCNLIGLSLCTAAPLPTAGIIRLDVVPPNTAGAMDWAADARQCIYLVKSVAELGDRLPAYLLQVDKCLADEAVSDRFLHLHMSSLLKQWTHTAEVVTEARRRQQESGAPEGELTDLLRCLGVQEQDHPLISYWA